jgi:3-methylfumaryl-CoA hydratase
LRLDEERDVVYRQTATVERDPPGHASLPAATGGVEMTADLTMVVNPALLFCFSALTGNAHRVHYDKPYATKVEGHAERLVHGPLSALLATEAVRRSIHRPVRAFDFKLTAPALCGSTLSYCVTQVSKHEAFVAGLTDGVQYLELSAQLEPLDMESSGGA